MDKQNTVECACPCGATRFSVTGAPRLRAFCHCGICRRFNDSDYADITVFSQGQVDLPDDHPVDFQTYRKPPAVQRGKCAECGKPAIEYLRLPLLPDVVFVPTANLPESARVAPSMRIFYDNRVQDVDDTLLRHEGYWPSQLAFLKQYLAGMF